MSIATEFAGTMPVAERNRFDVDRLDAYLRERVPGYSGKLSVEQFRGGQSNPTFLLKLDGVNRYVLRKKPAGQLLPSAHAVDREFRVISALRDTGVPVAPAVCLCDDDSVIGTMFYVMDFVAGRNFWDPALPGMSGQERGAIFAEMNRVIASLHALDYAAAGLQGFGKPGNYLVRQIARWTKQYRASETERLEAMENLIAWLPENIPPGDETSLVHGDFRLDNMIFHPTEARVLAVVDWELSTLGHPLADFSYHVMSWRLSPEEFRGLAGFDFKRLGIPAESEYVSMYCSNTGRDGIDPRHWDIYLAYNMFRIACIRQGILKRALEGTAASAHAVEAGRRAKVMAEMGWQQALAVRAPK